MAETKLTRTKVPNMHGKPKKKLGIVLSKNRQNTTFRLRQITISRFEEVMKNAKQNISAKLSRTDILESLIDWANQQPVDALRDILLRMGRDENNVV